MVVVVNLADEAGGDDNDDDVDVDGRRRENASRRSGEWRRYVRSDFLDDITNFFFRKDYRQSLSG